MSHYGTHERARDRVPEFQGQGRSPVPNFSSANMPCFTCPQVSQSISPSCEEDVGGDKVFIDDLHKSKTGHQLHRFCVVRLFRVDYT